LIRHGIPPSERYKGLLEAVRDAQLDGKITSKQQALALVDQLLVGPPCDTDSPRMSID
jgi:hypothetical protein